MLAKRQDIGFLQQSKASNHWAAALDATAAFKTLNYRTKNSVPDPDVQAEYFDWTSATGIMKEQSRFFIDSTSGLPKINFSGEDTKSLLAGHLAAALQKVTEAATTPYAKTFTPADEVLAFDNNEGFLFTLALKNYDNGSDTGDGVLLKNALLDNFSFEIMPNNRGIARLASINGTWVGNEMVMEQYFSGNWVARPTSESGFYNTSSLGFTLPTLTVGSTNLANSKFRRFMMNINNGVTSDLKTTGGKADNYLLNTAITFEVDIPYNNTTYKALKSYQSGDAVQLVFQNGAGTSDGQIKFVSDVNFLTGNPFIYEGEYQAIRLQMESVLRNAQTWNGMILMTDTIDWGF